MFFYFWGNVGVGNGLFYGGFLVEIRKGDEGSLENILWRVFQLENAFLAF